MNVKCEACGKVSTFRATRGARLAEHRCTCGGTLRKARMTPTGYEIAVGTPGPTGPMVTCPVCGSRRRSGGYNVKRLSHDARFYKQEGAIEVPGGALVCWFHIPMTDTAHSDVPVAEVKCG